jgi:alpha-ketoglutarate-dependent taurine dioxygenase
MVIQVTDPKNMEQSTSSQTLEKDISAESLLSEGALKEAGLKCTRVPAARGSDTQFLPLTIQPLQACSSQRLTELCNWLRQHAQTIQYWAMQHGAILFRDFPITCPEDFDQIRQAFPMIPMPYFGGAAVRKLVHGDHIFTTNESPPSEPIPFHHELSQTPEPPDYIAFYCQTPALQGGETPLIDSRAMYAFIAKTFPTFTQNIEALGVKYVRILPDEDDTSSAIGRSWRSTWQTQDRAIAEKRMREQGMQWQWLPGGALKTITRALPALRTDPRDGTPVFFNSMIAAYKGWIDSRNIPEKAILLGDDSPLPAEVLDAIFDFMQTQAVEIPWQAGDVILIDNWITMHARNPFTGTRIILAAIGRAEVINQSVTDHFTI